MCCPATLYLVATPIGNLEDMTYRGVRVLSRVSRIACEDTRHSRKLLSHYRISTPLVSYHSHNAAARQQQLLAWLAAGESLALISDAGMPGISDPGQALVAAVRQAGYQVTPIPGACAAVCALAASGLPTDSFLFEGFLPRRSGPRQQKLRHLAAAPETIIVYEAANRVAATLKDLAAYMEPQRPLVLARELTKLHEAFWCGSLGQARQETLGAGMRGEVVLLLGGCAQQEQTKPASDAELLDLLATALAEGQQPPSAVVRALAQEHGCSRSRLYQLYLQHYAGQQP